MINPRRWYTFGDYLSPITHSYVLILWKVRHRTIQRRKQTLEGRYFPRRSEFPPGCEFTEKSNTKNSYYSSYQSRFSESLFISVCIIILHILISGKKILRRSIRDRCVNIFATSLVRFHYVSFIRKIADNTLSRKRRQDRWTYWFYSLVCRQLRRARILPIAISRLIRN